MEKKTFDVIILNGRPAAGKSEVIDYLKKIPLQGARSSAFTSASSRRSTTSPSSGSASRTTT